MANVSLSPRRTYLDRGRGFSQQGAKISFESLHYGFESTEMLTDGLIELLYRRAQLALPTVFRVQNLMCALDGIWSLNSSSNKGCMLNAAIFAGSPAS
jgi:hypothetical protein